MSKYDDFTGSNIFYKDDKGNTIYEKENIHYIVNDTATQNRLKDIEGYSYFLYGDNKPVTFIMAFIFIAVPLTLVIKLYLFPDIDENLLPLPIALFIHWIIKYFYNKKIDDILINSPVLSQKEINSHIENTKQKDLIQEVKKKEVKKVIQKYHSTYDDTTRYEDSYKDEKSLLQKIKYITSDYTLFHLILFLIIASPFLFFAYYLIKASLLG